MQNGGHLRSVEPQFVRNLLRFKSWLLGEKLLNSIRVAHTEQQAFLSPTVSHAVLGGSVSTSWVASPPRSTQWIILLLILNGLDFDDLAAGGGLSEKPGYAGGL